MTRRQKDSESEADPTCTMKTRSRNATTHPGNIVLENHRARRSKEEVQEEKEQKKARKEADERKRAKAEAWREAGNAYIEQLEEKEAAAAANARMDFLLSYYATDAYFVYHLFHI